ncbi:MAG: hypothetical protein E7018_01645 [Alphaproteobacteria bacterium]|nr:hypothetical protein [Alphaproteobacteria bacterium]
MKKSVYAVIAACFVLCTSVVCAKVYWLPDYMTGEMQKKEVNGRTKQLPTDANKFNRTNNFGCGAYGATAASDVGTQDCSGKFKMSNGEWCYTGCCQPCANVSTPYYTASSSLVSTYAGLSNSIYSSCFDECRSKTFYYPSGCKSSSAQNCTDQTYCTYSLNSPDENGCGSCVGKACQGGAASTVDGCGTYSGNGYYTLSSSEQSTCASLTCKKCVANACPSGYAVSVGYCGSVEHGSYSLGSAHSTYTQCKKCVVSCNSCYSLSGSTSCAPATCPTGYATTAAGCGTAPTNSVYSTTSSTSGCSGSSSCYKCQLSCKNNFYQSQTSCGTDTTRCVYSISSPDTNQCGTCSYACNTTGGYVTSCTAPATQCSASLTNTGSCGSKTCGTCSYGCATNYVSSCTAPATQCSATLTNTATCGSKTCGTCSYGCATNYVSSCTAPATQCSATLTNKATCGSKTCGTCSYGCATNYVSSCTAPATQCSASLTNTATCGSKTCGTCSYGCATNYVSSCTAPATQCSATLTNKATCGSKTCGTCSYGCASGYVSSCTNPTNGKATLTSTATCGSKTCGTCSYSCNDNYYLSGTTCTACSWGDYTLSSGSGVTGAKGYEAKTCGNITKYKITGCKDGYTQSGNTCTAKSCQAGYATAVSGCGTAPTNSQYSLGSTTNGYSGELACKNCKLSCKSGKASSCSSGYEVTGADSNGCGTCTACTWNGYTLTSRNVANAAAYAESACGGTTKYKVTACSTGYDVNSTGTACIAQSCPSGQATSVVDCGTGPSNGYYRLGASSGSSVGGVACQYCIWSCHSGYKMCNGDCVSYCSSYSSDYDSCPQGADCNYDSNTCCYSVSGCQSGYQYCYGNCIPEGDYCY